MKTSPNQAQSKGYSFAGSRKMNAKQFDDLLFTGRMPMADETPPKLTKKQAAHAANAKLAVALVVGGIAFAISFVICSIFIHNEMISALISTGFFLPVFYGIMKMQDHHFMNVEFNGGPTVETRDAFNGQDPYYDPSHPLYQYTCGRKFDKWD